MGLGTILIYTGAITLVAGVVFGYLSAQTDNNEEKKSRKDTARNFLYISLASWIGFIINAVVKVLL